MSDPAASGAVVVVNYGDPSVLLENPVLRAGAPWHVVVVDNLSTTQHRVRARALAAEHGWELLEPAANLGFGRGVNLGVQRAADAGRAAVLVVNPDAALEPEVQRIILIDGPVILGWQTLREIQEAGSIAMIEVLVRRAISEGSIEPSPVRELTHMLVAALEEAALLVAHSSDPDEARAASGEILDRLLRALTSSRTA